MFYGFRRKGDREFLDGAVKRFRQSFRRVVAIDNTILFDRTIGFKDDEKFMQALERNAAGFQERALILRLHTLAWGALQALHTAGDFVECGVYRGFCSAVVADYVDFATLPRQFYLYDTFAGIPPEYDSEKHDHSRYHSAGLHDFVRERFARFPNVRIVRGVVPDAFAEAVPSVIAFLHIDMNSSKSEIAALEVLFDRVSPGGVIVFDDYGWLDYEAQLRAEHEFMQRRGHPILELPTGQGLVIKH
jgi:O-methyltransferase